MGYAKLFEGEVWKPNWPEPDITRNKLKIYKVSRNLDDHYYPGQEEDADADHEVGEPGNLSVKES